MNFQGYKFRDYAAWAVIALSVLLLLSSAFTVRSPRDLNSESAKVQRIVSSKMEMVDVFIQKAMESPRGEWLDIGEVPKDIVLYRYYSDTLQSWRNSFTVLNDDISRRFVFHTLTNPRVEVESPLADITETPSFVNFGSKWYLVKMHSEGNCKVIGGLEIVNTLAMGSRGVNPCFHLSENYTVCPLDYSGGQVVKVGEVPVFKVLYDSLEQNLLPEMRLIWAALLLFLCGVSWNLFNRKTIRCYLFTVLSLLLSLGSMYLWGYSIRGKVILFSPLLYADGPVFFSLGAVLLINIFLTLFVICTYVVRYELYRKIRERNLAKRLVAVSASIVVLMLGLVLYSGVAFKSIVLNSDITLELYKFADISSYTILVYASFISLLSVVPLLLQMLRPGLKAAFGLRFDALGIASRLICSALFAVYLVLISSGLGLLKESYKVGVWANRLSVDRDIALELDLRSVEAGIAQDAVIAALAPLDNTGSIVLNRLIDNYFARFSQDYDFTVFVLDESKADAASISYFNQALEGGSPIADGSHFLFKTTTAGYLSYEGVFTYVSSDKKVSHLLVTVEPKSNKGAKGYAALLGDSSPGKVILPGYYSFAKYKDGELVSYDGEFAYPTLMSWQLRGQGDNSRHEILVKDNYIHFTKLISEGEIIVISRKSTGLFSYVINVMSVSLIFYLLLMVTALSKRKPERKAKRLYRSRVSSIVVVSLLVTLVTMSFVSVLFVYKRNESNRYSLMSSKINSIQSFIEYRCRAVSSVMDLSGQDFASLLESVSEMSDADIVLYTTSGKVFRSTAPEVFNRMVLGERMDDQAYRSLIYEHKRYFVHKERLADKSYYGLYAPVFNDQGKMIAILGSPFVDDGYSFESDVVSHLVAIFTVFLILLIMARFMARKVIDKLFQPIVEMGNKMRASEVKKLRPIIYNNEDEISSLVDSYNRMVQDLKISAGKLAQVERDKAWNSMARQVAHEIKNPLTPMKLQLQRLVRLKQKNAPDWDVKFDDAIKVVLEHIDTLSETASEFSNLAKLYTEAPVPINLDALLQEEISMYDNNENVGFSYYGLESVQIMGPKPQLTRVFVNLMNNAVQAIEIKQQQDLQQGLPYKKGLVQVSLRKSSTLEDGYDIVFEDNGPGVSEENLSKLFTPNFTTKSGGSGLGLAISHSILEKCSATINYSKSFGLGGACFTITYPGGK